MSTNTATLAGSESKDPVPLYIYYINGLDTNKIRREIRKTPKDEHVFYGTTRKTRRWNEMLKTLDKDPELPAMITRVLFLDTLMKPPYLLHELLADRNTHTNRFIKVLRLASMLLDQIVPRIERHLSKKVESEHQWSKSVHGTISWMPTLLDAARNANQFPLRFLCRVERVYFDTPENILTVYAILRLRYDVEGLLHVCKDLDYLTVLKKIRWRADRVLRRTVLQDLIRTAEKYKGMEPSSKLIEKRMRDVHARVRRGEVKQKAYLELIGWLEDYKRYKTTSKGEGVVEFKQSVQTLYEYWILYEIAYYFKKKRIKVEKKIESRRIPAFQITQNGIDFQLRYQDRCSGWKRIDSDVEQSNSQKKHIISRPDFTIGIGDRRHIVLDAKYYKPNKQNQNKYPNSSQVNHAMLGYLMNLTKYDSRVGVLFFPGSTHDESPPERFVEEYVYAIKDKPKRKFKLAIMKSMNIKHERSKKEILEKIFAYVCDMDARLH